MKVLKPTLVTLFSFCALSFCWSQSEDCNQLGVWLWHVEDTGFSHEVLATNLSQRDIKRVYVKVADGRIDSSRWTELVDTELIRDYKEHGIQPWAWSYNYRNNYADQAQAIYYAAKTGYSGYVVDVEIEFDGRATLLDSLFRAFHLAKQKAIADNHAATDFQLYVTTWGNPRDHNYSIRNIDPYVDGFMPQTYVEYWGPNYVDDITFWIEEGNQEYLELGATKPIHHIASTATGVMTSELIDEFIAASGPETSLWRVPGGGVPIEVWQDWNEVDWSMNFCEETATDDLIVAGSFTMYPNPTDSRINYSCVGGVGLYNLNGQLLMKEHRDNGQIDLSSFSAGIYILKSIASGEAQRFFKL